MKKKPYQPPVSHEALHFKFEQFDQHDVIERHQHTFGQLLYCAAGIMQISTGDTKFIAPPQYAVWIPPNIQHSASILQNASYQSVYIDKAQAARLPAKACVLEVTALIKALLSEFSQGARQGRNIDKDRRLGLVLIDQLEDAHTLESYLPGSQDTSVQVVLHELSVEPGANKTLGQWAQQLNVTERTLIRKFIKETGLTFGEWKRRARFLAAVQQLNEGVSVETVGLNLGYSTSSAFIAMFRRACGSTPENFRRGVKRIG